MCDSFVKSMDQGVSVHAICVAVYICVLRGEEEKIG